MSWATDLQLTWCEQFAVNVIKCGPIPRHVAFIMDGNRRYAKSQNMETIRGHDLGAKTLRRIMKCCKEIGIAEATVFAFSIENFKRSENEVEHLMDLCRSEFSQLLEEYADFMRSDIRIRFIGKLDLLPKDLCKLASQIEFMTRNNNSLVLNMALAYTSREEITNAIRTVVGGVQAGVLDKADVDADLLSKCMYTNRSPDPDIIIRTSGETRLSDFLLWQSGNARIFIEKVMWPQFSIWHLLKIIFLYQIDYGRSKMKNCLMNIKTEESTLRKDSFLKTINDERIRVLKSYLENNL